MHLNGLRKADRLARQALNLRTQRQVFALDLLGVALARLVLTGFEMTRVSAPVVRVITPAVVYTAE